MARRGMDGRTGKIFPSFIGDQPAANHMGFTGDHFGDYLQGEFSQQDRDKLISAERKTAGTIGIMNRSC